MTSSPTPRKIPLPQDLRTLIERHTADGTALFDTDRHGALADVSVHFARPVALGQWQTRSIRTWYDRDSNPVYVLEGDVEAERRAVYETVKHAQRVLDNLPDCNP
jgi:hypothetical protein